ncbi:glucose-6-phosphate isomerase [Candidatus Micrarchaeota archaeon]|nr:glucose-6-phosphate isomerase [Candidatus Micrarchaeota archaeon]
MKIRNAGLLTELSSDFRLSIEGQELGPDIRTVKQMRPVLLDADGLKVGQGTYFMYREAGKPDDRSLFADRSLRYDITVVPSVMLGSEYNKTLGHYHPDSVRPPLSYPELYEVLHGTAHYLLQKRKSSPAGTLEIERCFLVECRAGEKAIMPPDYGHITVNKGQAPVVMDNIVERTFKSVYEPYIQRRGGAYYVTTTGEKKNPSFKNLPELERIRAPEFNRMVNAEIAEALEKGYAYALYLENPDFFSWLVDPKDVELW